MTHLYEKVIFRQNRFMVVLDLKNKHECTPLKYIEVVLNLKKKQECTPLKYIEVSNWCIRQGLELKSLGKLKFVSSTYQPFPLFST